MNLEALTRAARVDLERLNYPPPAWTLPHDRMIDVLVVGGGMCGQTAQFALRREGIHAIRTIDRAARGAEGPWDTFARMPTLRSPKHLTGPDLGIPALTYRAWHEAKYGVPAWEALYKIDRLDWRDYLLWVRDAVGLVVENRRTLIALAPRADAVEATLDGETIRARRVVLALGREGSGTARWPHFASWRPELRAPDSRIRHAAEPIDFAMLAGARVGVLGAGATAFDNAGSALEAGAREVVMFARRAALPQVNRSKWASFAGFQQGFVALDDAHRWAFLTTIFDAQVPPPFESVLRCERHAGFSIRFSSQWHDLAEAGGQALADGEPFDWLIVATGFDVDLTERPELAGFRDRIALWAERVSAEAAVRHPEASRFPYLGPGFELIDRSGDSALARIHVFNWGSTMSHGQLAGDIPGLETGARRLAATVARELFLEDADRHYAAMRAFDERELAPTRYATVSRASPPTPSPPPPTSRDRP